MYVFQYSLECSCRIWLHASLFHLPFKYQFICSAEFGTCCEKLVLSHLFESSIMIFFLLYQNWKWPCGCLSFSKQEMTSINHNELSDWTAKAISVCGLAVIETHSSIHIQECVTVMLCHPLWILYYVTIKHFVLKCSDVTKRQNLYLYLFFHLIVVW